MSVSLSFHPTYGGWQQEAVPSPANMGPVRSWPLCVLAFWLGSQTSPPTPSIDLILRKLLSRPVMRTEQSQSPAGQEQNRVDSLEADCLDPVLSLTHETLGESGLWASHSSIVRQDHGISHEGSVRGGDDGTRGLVLGLAVVTGTEMVMVLTVDCRDFPVVQWLGLHTPNAGGAGSVPGQGTRSHMPQPKIPYAATRTPHATMKTEDPVCCS